MSATFSFVIRDQAPQDAEAVHEVNVRAFGRAGEANLVDRLSAKCHGLISLVAQTDDCRIIGHAMFSPARIDSESGHAIHGYALGPIAVEPGMQRLGVGSAMINRGIDRLIERRCPFVVVLGHPQYYPRFGFEPAGSRYGIRCTWDVSDPVFMIRMLDADLMHGVTGVAHYREEFNQL